MDYFSLIIFSLVTDKVSSGAGYLRFVFTFHTLISNSWHTQMNLSGIWHWSLTWCHADHSTNLLFYIQNWLVLYILWKNMTVYKLCDLVFTVVLLAAF